MIKRRHKSYLILIVFLVICHQLYAQSNQASYTVAQPLPLLQSPNAASLGQYGAIEISPFTGLANVSIPVFSLNEGDIPVTASLSYNTGGVKPETHPGWVGQNWTLAVGGVVTRKQNGSADEIPSTLFSDSNAVSYYYKYSLLNDTSWASSNFVNTNFPYPIPNGFTGNQCDLSPDEFFFTLPNGSSGSFLLNHSGQWQVKSNQPGQFNISVSLAYNFTLADSVFYKNQTIALSLSSIHRIIYSIIITDANGVKYTFGNDSNAIDFVYGQLTTSSYYEEVVANAWYLTKIESPTGHAVNLIYQRKANQYVQDVTYQRSIATTSSGTVVNAQSGPNYSAHVITPAYLKEIDGPSFKVLFKVAASTELQYDYSSNYYASLSNLNYPNVATAPGTSAGSQLMSLYPPLWYELKEIDVQNIKDSLLQAYVFTYNNDSSKRLFLQKYSKLHGGINLLDANGFSLQDSTDISYLFDYNTTQLPSYNSMKVDQWGYYNNVFFNPNDSTTPPSAWLATYFAPNFSYASAGTLTKIHYPTGGSTSFNYELNDYSNVLQKNGDQINLVSQSGQGGGLKIKQIIDSSVTGLPITKTYSYTNSSGASSGILAGNKSIVMEAYFPGTSASLTTVSNNSNGDLDYTNGKDVVYSQVKEAYSNGGYNIYKYANSDSTVFRDTIPVYLDFRMYEGGTALSGSIDTSIYAYPNITPVSREMERGQLLSKQTYNASGNLVYNEQNQYRNDAARFGEFVRAYDDRNVIFSYIMGLGVTFFKDFRQAIKNYTYFPYLNKKTITTYDTTGNNPVTVIKSFGYDNTLRLLRTDTVWNSKQQIINTTYKYPVDYSSTPYTGMDSANILLPVIEQTQFNGTTQLQWKSIPYFKDGYNHYLPSMNLAQLGTNAIDTLATYTQYDALGNLQAAKPVNSPSVCYLWGYNGLYPVAKVIGSNITNIQGLISQPYLDSAAYYNDDQIRSALNNIRTSLAGNAVLVYTYTYNQHIGMTSETNPAGITTYYEYDAFGRLSTIKDQYGHIIKSYTYHYLTQYP